MVQRLPQASKGLKNILEEEWDFVKKRCRHVRGGEVEGGTRFWYIFYTAVCSINFLQQLAITCSLGATISILTEMN